MNALTLFDILSLIALWWTASAALEGGNEVDDWTRAALVISLVGVQTSSILGALTLITQPMPLPWWMRGILYSGSIFAAWFYDRRFGIVRHLRMAGGCIASRAKAVRASFKGERNRRGAIR